MRKTSRGTSQCLMGGESESAGRDRVLLRNVRVG